MYPKFMLLNPPSPPGYNVYRGFAGGFGTAEVVNRKDYGHTGYVLLPIFIVYGSSALQKLGCKFSVLDGQALNYSLTQVINAVKREKPDILLSWISLPSMYDDLRLLNKIKKSSPDTFIVALGTVCNVLPEYILKSDVDLLIKGFYPYYNATLHLVEFLKNNPINEENFNKIPGAVYISDHKLFSSPLEPCSEYIDELWLEVYNLLPVDKYLCKDQRLDGSYLYLFPILIGVGCPYPCTHCPYPIGYGKKIIYKSVEGIIAEIEFLKRNFGINGFMFRAQDFTQNKKRVFNLCEELIKRNLNIEWIIETRPDLVSKELLLEMKKAGCFKINYGVESGNPELLKKIGRSAIHIETIKNAFEITKKLGIWAHAHMILGLPGENQRTLKKTFKLIRELNPDSTSWNLMTPYPGTKFFDFAKEKGWISSSDWSEYSSFNPVIRTDELNEKQLQKAKRDIKWKLRIFRLLNNSNYRKRIARDFIKKVFKK